MSLPAVIDELRKIAGRDAVLDRPEDLMLYEYDAGVRKSTPGAVVFPQNTQQVSEIMRVASAARVPVVGRGAGTGLSGGAISPQGGIVIAFSRMNRILEVDAANLRAVVQPGVVNLQLSEYVSQLGPVFRARSLQPEGLHHRRQRRGKFGWSAHFAARRDREPCHRS